jgi:hypothetical protein
MCVGKYHPEALMQATHAYDLTLQEYWLRIGRTEELAWSANMAQNYSALSRQIEGEMFTSPRIDLHSSCA